MEYSAREVAGRKTCASARTEGFEAGKVLGARRVVQSADGFALWEIVPQTISNPLSLGGLDMYRCEAKSLAAFIQQLAVNYISRGYYFWVQGHIPEPKDPAKTDQKIMQQYGIAVSKWVKARQRKRGEASLQYLRHGRDFVILATHGKHRFFAEEGKQVQDVRRVPIKHGGYSVGYWQGFEEGHVSVRIEANRFRELKEYQLKHALRASVTELVSEFAAFSVLPFAPVRQQVLSLGRAINRVRKLAGLECIPLVALLRPCGWNRNGLT